MISDVSNALNAYQQALGRIGASPAMKEVDKAKADTSFSAVLQNTVEEAVSTMKKAENISMLGIAGKADVQDVVMAISNAEQTLDTVVAFRDTAIKAYKEIIQMNI